jgi:hypothetical protein
VKFENPVNGAAKIEVEFRSRHNVSVPRWWTNMDSITPDPPGQSLAGVLIGSFENIVSPKYSGPWSAAELSNLRLFMEESTASFDILDLSGVRVNLYDGGDVLIETIYPNEIPNNLINMFRSPELVPAPSGTIWRDRTSNAYWTAGGGAAWNAGGWWDVISGPNMQINAFGKSWNDNLRPLAFRITHDAAPTGTIYCGASAVKFGELSNYGSLDVIDLAEVDDWSQDFELINWNSPPIGAKITKMEVLECIPAPTTTTTSTTTTSTISTTTTTCWGPIGDTFTGPDLDPPNPALWSIVTQKVRLLNNELNMLMDSTPNPEVDLIPNIGDGDFDVSVDYELLQTTTAADWYIIMSAWDQAPIGFCNGTYVGVMRGAWSGVHEYRLYYCSGSSYGYLGATATSDMSGKLRLTRSADAWKAIYWNGATWVTIAQWTQVTHPVGNVVEPVTFQLRNLTGSPVLEVALDNFCVNSMEAITTTTTTTTTTSTTTTTCPGYFVDLFDDGIIGPWWTIGYRT